MVDNITLDTMSGGSVVATIDTGSEHIQKIASGDAVISEDGFTRVADTNIYAAGDLIANSTTAGSCTAANSAFVLANIIRDDSVGCYITQIMLRKSDDDVTAPNFRVHFFDTDPFASAPTSGDNVAIVLNSAAADDYLGYIDVTCDLQVVSGNNHGVGYPTLPIPVKPATGTTIWGVLEARGAYTPASAEVFTLHAHVAQV